MRAGGAASVNPRDPLAAEIGSVSRVWEPRSLLASPVARKASSTDAKFPPSLAVTSQLDSRGRRWSYGRNAVPPPRLLAGRSVGRRGSFPRREDRLGRRAVPRVWSVSRSGYTRFPLRSRSRALHVPYLASQLGHPAPTMRRPTEASAARHEWRPAARVAETGSRGDRGRDPRSDPRSARRGDLLGSGWLGSSAFCFWALGRSRDRLDELPGFGAIFRTRRHLCSGT